MLVFSQKTQAEFSLQSLLWTCFITEFLWQNSYQTVVSQARKHKNNTGQVQVSSSMTYRILLSRMKHTLRYMTPKMKYVTRVLHLSHERMDGKQCKIEIFPCFPFLFLLFCKWNLGKEMHILFSTLLAGTKIITHIQSQQYWLAAHGQSQGSPFSHPLFPPQLRS